MSAPVALSGLPTKAETLAQIEAGSRCVRYALCGSFLIATLHRESRAYLTTDAGDRLWRGVPFTVACLVCGPWGLPWGPILTAQALWQNLTGGRDVTAEVVAALREAGG